MNFIPYFDEIKDFTRLSDCTEKVELALSRLESPVEITEEKVLMYQDYLFKSAPSVVPQFIDLNKISVFPLLVKYRVIRKANILKFTEYAREAKRMDILSYLMDVGYQLKTKPKNLNIAPKFTRGKTDLNSSFVPDYSTAKAGQIIWLGYAVEGAGKQEWQIIAVVYVCAGLFTGGGFLRPTVLFHIF